MMMINAAAITARIHAVMQYDGIPTSRRAAHLRDKCGISPSTARRWLRAFPPNGRSDFFYRLATGLDVDRDWLLLGHHGKWHPRTFRAEFECIKGYPPKDAGRMVRLMTGYMAGHRKATSLFNLAASGQISLHSASMLL